MRSWLPYVVTFMVNRSIGCGGTTALARFFDYACAAAELWYGGRQSVPLWAAGPTQFSLLGKAGSQERDLARARRARCRLVRRVG